MPDTDSTILTSTRNGAERDENLPRTPGDEVPDADTRLGWLRKMMLIREFELRTMQAYQQAKIGGFCHVYSGQEAVAVGCVAAIEDEDPIITAYRDHGHGLVRGVSPRAGMAELFGKVGGCSKGKGGSMHFFSVRDLMYGGHAIVGAQTPLGVGLAFATRYRHEVLGEGGKRVCLCFMGDGALNQGAVHEAMNLAVVLGTPCIFIVENNGYAMGTHIARGTANPYHLGARADADGLPGYEIDGMPCLAVFQAMKPVVAWCREHQFPAFINIKTYRYKGHSMSDPQKYRTKEEVSQYQDSDPILKLTHQLMEEQLIDEAGAKRLDEEVKAEIKDAVAWADASPLPDPATDLYADVYADPYPPYRETTYPKADDDDPYLPEPAGNEEGNEGEDDGNG